MIRDIEYDAFGPWIYIIDDKHKMPPLFVPYHLESANPLLMIKMPRQINRRDAHPGMNLYDYVIGMFDSYLHILKRDDKNVVEKRVYYKDICAMRQAHCLLKGELFFYLNDELVTLDYNTVSDDIISQMIELIKEQYLYKKQNLCLAQLPYNFNNVEYLYVNLINSLKKKDADMNLVAYQPKVSVERKQKSIISKIISFIFNKQYFQSTAFITNNKELIIIEKGAPESVLNTYYFSYLFLPYTHISCVALCTRTEKKQDVKFIRLKVHNYSFVCVYDDKNTGIDDLYEAMKKLTTQM